MLTKEEIKNLRIGDEIYVAGKKEYVTSLDLRGVETSTSYRDYDDEEGLKISLNPPKIKKKYWLWAVMWYDYSDLVITSSYYDDKGYTVQGSPYIKDIYFAKKLDYTMIEIEEEK